MTIPRDLGPGGRKLYRDITANHELSPEQLVTLEAAARMKDRCDLLAGEASEGDHATIRQERDSSLAMARLLTALRLPDASGKRAPLRPLKGAYKPTTAGSISSLERARAQKSG